MTYTEMASTTFEESTFFDDFLYEYNNDEDDLTFDELFNDYYHRMITTQDSDYVREAFNYFFKNTEPNDTDLYTLLYYMSHEYVNDHYMSEADTDFSSDIEEDF
jgi:hypothetical protein